MRGIKVFFLFSLNWLDGNSDIVVKGSHRVEDIEVERGRIEGETSRERTLETYYEGKDENWPSFQEEDWTKMSLKLPLSSVLMQRKVESE